MLNCLYRALRLPVIANAAAAILREADIRGMLDGVLLVIGTNALAAYELEAGARFAAGLDATEDIDLSWAADGTTLALKGGATNSVFDMHLAAGESLAPLCLPSQTWLVAGKPVLQTVCARDGSFARIAAPDPRLFALHKLWLSKQPSRERRKRAKDRAQGEALLTAIAANMPHYPMNKDFLLKLPEELRSCLPANLSLEKITLPSRRKPSR